MDIGSSKTPVKVTYAKRSNASHSPYCPQSVSITSNNEQRRQQSEDNDYSEDEVASTRSVSRQGSMRGKHMTPGKPSSSASTKTPKKPTSSAATKTPRRIDPRDVPGPTPRRGRRNSDDGSEKATRPRTRSQSRPRTIARDSSQRGRRNSDEESEGPPRTRSRSRPRSVHTRTKSLVSVKTKSVTGSVRGRPSIGAKPASKRAQDEEEEEGSVAESFAESLAAASVGGKITRTAKDRQEYFKNQSDCRTFGPHRALCSRCKQLVNLARKQTYAVAPWEKHRAKCDQELASDSPLPPDADALVNLSAEEIFAEQPVRRNAAERRAYLLADKFIQTVEEERVLCAKCEKWIALKKGQPYDLAKWKQHRDKCTPEIERTLSTEKRLTILNDPLVKSFGAGTIECGQCGAKISGNVGQHHDLGAWEEHKAQCRSVSQKSGSEGANSVPFPASEKPPSKTSTAATLVAAEGSVTMRQTGNSGATKRARDDYAEDEPPLNRPRNETYEPPAEESPGVLGWFMLPFHSFARGFRESLKGGRSS